MAAVVCRTGFKGVKHSAGSFFIPVDLPQAAELVVGGAIFDKALYILGGIAEKQTDLVREPFAAAQLARERRKTFSAAFAGVTLLSEQLGGFTVLQIAGKLRRAEQIKENVLFGITQRQQAEQRLSCRKDSSTLLREVYAQVNRLPVLIPASVGAPSRTITSSDIRESSFRAAPHKGVRDNVTWWKSIHSGKRFPVCKVIIR